MGSASSGDAIRSHQRLGGDAAVIVYALPQADRGLRLADLQRRSAARPAAEGRVPRAAPRHRPRRADRSVGRRHRRQRAEGLGGRARRDALHALVPADHRHHRGKARCVPEPDQRRPRRRRVQRQGAGQGRAGCVELPVGRHALNLRGPRLHGVGSDQPALAAGHAPRHDARHSDRVRQLDRRGARQEDAAAALAGGALEAGGPHPQAVRLARAARRHDLRPRAGVLPDRPAVLFQPPRPDQRRPHAVRRRAAEGPGDGGPLLRLDPNRGSSAS